MQKLGISLCKYDEMDSLIRGVHHICQYFPNECYYWENPGLAEKSAKVPYPSFGPNPYPYILVNIGSGVSILQVSSAQDFKRIGGTSVGGGSFCGLCALLTGTESFDEAISLAEHGDNTKVDKLVRDIYGSDYNKMGLTGNVVASR